MTESGDKVQLGEESLESLINTHLNRMDSTILIIIHELENGDVTFD